MERREFRPDLEQIATDHPEKKETTPKRLMLSVEALLKLSVKGVTVEGLESLKELPQDAKVIVAVSHTSDLDVPIAIKALGNEINLSVANESVHHHFVEEPATNIGLRLAGKDNFMPIDFKKTPKGKRPKNFNPENFEPMAEALHNGKAVLLAAHNPSHKTGEKVSEKKGGYGAVYLAEISDAYIVPVVVSLDKPVGMFGDDLKTIKARPNAKVKVGSPFQLEKIDGIENMNKISSKRSSGQRLASEDRAEFARLSDRLKQQAEILIAKLSELE